MRQGQTGVGFQFGQHLIWGDGEGTQRNAMKTLEILFLYELIER